MTEVREFEILNKGRWKPSRLIRTRRGDIIRLKHSDNTYTFYKSTADPKHEPTTEVPDNHFIEADVLAGPPDMGRFRTYTRDSLSSVWYIFEQARRNG